MFMIDYTMWEFVKELLPLFIITEVIIWSIIIILNRSNYRSSERDHEKTNNKWADNIGPHNIR